MTAFFQKKVSVSSKFVYKLVELEFFKTYEWAIDKMVNGPSLGLSKKVAPFLNNENFKFLAFLPSEIPGLSVYSFDYSFGDFAYESEWMMMSFFKKSGKSGNILLCEDWTMKKDALDFRDGAWIDVNFKEKILLHDEDFYCYGLVGDFVSCKVPSRLNGSACFTFQGFLLGEDLSGISQEIGDAQMDVLAKNVLAIIFFGAYDGEGCIAAVGRKSGISFSDLRGSSRD